MVVATPPPKRFILATLDGWNYRLIDVSDVDAADTLRAVICKGVGIRDPGSAQIYLTEPGQMVHEEPLSDTMLVVNRRSKSDAQASLKFFVHSITPRPPNSRTPQSAGLGLSFDDRQRRNGGLDDPASLRPGRSPAGHYFPYIPSWPSLDEDDSLGDPMPDAGGGAASLASHEEHRKAVDRKNASQRKATSNGAQTTTKRDAVIDFDSPRISPYDERKLDNLVPFRKPPSAPTESNTLAKVNSLTKKPVKRNSGSHTDEQKEGSKGSDDRPRPLMLQTKAMTEKPGHSLAAALANVGKMSGSIGQPANTPVTPVDPKNGKQDSSPERHKSPISPPKLPQIQTGGDPLFRSLNFKGRKAPGGTGQAGGPGSPSLKTTGPDFDFKEAEVSFAKSPVPQDDSDDDSDDGLFAIPLANKPKVPKEKKPKDGQSDNKEPSTKPSLTVDTEPRAAKTRSVAFKSPSTAGEPSAGPSAHSAGTDHSEGHSAYTPNDGGVEVSTPDSSRNYRRESFVRDDVWASRPPVDGMLEHLDDFFPNIDLDEPYLEAIPQSPPVSPTSTPVRDESLTGVPTLPDRTLQSSPSMLSDSHVQDSSDTLGSNESTLKPRNSSVAQRNLAKSGGLSRVKTIREIARGAQQVRRRQSTVDTTAKYQTPLRRKSTKMFGARIMQISPQPGSRLSALDPLPQHHSVRDKLPQQQPTFRIIRGQLIGKGTYGKVYLGINADTGEILAVKLVEFGPKTTGNDRDRMREMVAAIDQEIDTMQHLEHPNIVQYLGCERAELSMSIYLEYIPGGSIGSCLRKHGKFEESVVKSLNRQVLCGLAYLHDQGILHRDLKADNILLDLDGTCKISDFGISKKTDNIYGNDVTNSMQGSVFWMAPEVVQSQGQGYSAKVDIWSLGCVVLEMFAGRRPWSTEEAIGAIFKLGSLNQAPPIPEDVSLNISPPALAFMLDCFTM
jgi:mitogen-activated protein kinase kinase kinase